MCLAMSNLSINNFVIANLIQQVTQVGVEGTTGYRFVIQVASSVRSK